MTRRAVGRVASRLTRLLEAQAFTDVVLWPATGHWRTSRFADVYPWEGRGIATVPRKVAGLPVSFCSWFTMTACVRHGINVDVDAPLGSELIQTVFEVSALPASTTPTGAPK